MLYFKINKVNDKRLHSLKTVHTWFKDWRNEVRDIQCVQKQKDRMLPSYKCLDDVESTIVGFINFCQVHLSEFNNGVYPSRFNSDLAENIFCQQRGLYNGNSTNPSYSTYCQTINSVILGQTVKSRARKSNSGLPLGDPYSFHVNVPLSKQKKKLPRI